MAQAFLRSWNFFMQIQYELLKHCQSEYLKLYVKFEANKEFMENLSLQFFRKSTICEKENEVENVWIMT